MRLPKISMAHVMSGVSFSFSSSGSAATVDSAGLAKGVSAGAATITASAAGVSGSVPLTVIPDPPSSPVLTQISVSPSTASIQPGQQQSYTAVGYDQFNNVMNGLTFTWSSDGNSSVAILNGNVATGAGPGITHITASALGITQRAGFTDSDAASPFPEDDRGYSVHILRFSSRGHSSLQPSVMTRTAIPSAGSRSSG